MSFRASEARHGIQEQINWITRSPRHAPVCEPGNDKEEIATPRKARLAMTPLKI